MQGNHKLSGMKDFPTRHDDAYAGGCDRKISSSDTSISLATSRPTPLPIIAASNSLALSRCTSHKIEYGKFELDNKLVGVVNLFFVKSIYI